MRMRTSNGYIMNNNNNEKVLAAIVRSLQKLGERREFPPVLGSHSGSVGDLG